MARFRRALLVAGAALAPPTTVAAPLPVVLHAWRFPDDVIGTAFTVLEEGGAALPAVVRGTQQAELNPDVHNVGSGGTPDSAGETTLDALCVPARYPTPRPWTPPVSAPSVSSVSAR